MKDSPIETIRNARLKFEKWLEQTRKSPDPWSQEPTTFREFATSLQAVEQALAEAPASLRAGDAWKKETTEYAGTLQEVKARLSNFEITLRIRNAQMARKQTSLDVVRSWADLARNVG